MVINVNSFIQNVLSPCFDLAKPKITNEKHLTREEYNAKEAWQPKYNAFRYNATAVIANSALVATVASVALAAFGVIGPLFSAALLAVTGLTYFNAFVDLGLLRYARFDGLERSDKENWKQQSLNLCDLVGWYSFLPSPKKPDGQNPNAAQRTASPDEDSKESHSSSASSSEEVDAFIDGALFDLILLGGTERTRNQGVGQGLDD